MSRFPVADLRIDTYRKPGGGGWLNKPDTCVRITHVPSGVSVYECDDRSPHRNRAEAMRKMEIIHALVPELLAPAATPVASALAMGVSATKDGTTICLMQTHPDGKVTVIHSQTHPLGDTFAIVPLAPQTN